MISWAFQEVPPGFEPGIEVLQTFALPLGYGTIFRKSLMVEAGKFKQTSLDRLEKLGQSSIVPFLGRRGIKITHTLFLDRIIGF